ncbi:MAG: tetratricopeptide repeat protein [Burkholderiales bacterium]|nr:tetratricopeptide repeat protein [Burkholderiales bacterium]
MRILPTLFVSLMATAAFALPSQSDVKAAIAKGDYASAENMMHEVVVAKPNSANAHYVYSEILAHEGRFGEATDEALTAKKLDPAIHFTSPEKFRAYEAELLNSSNAPHHTTSTTSTVVTHSNPTIVHTPAMTSAPRQSSGGMGMLGFVITLVIVIAVIGWLISLFGRRSPTVIAGGGAVPGGGNYTVGGGGYGAGPVVVNQGGGGIGAGLGGFAAGMVVGDLLERAIDRPHYGGGYGEGNTTIIENNTYVEDSRDTAEHDLENRQVDFGNSSSWDDSGSSSSFDSGGSSGSDDWS